MRKRNLESLSKEIIMTASEYAIAIITEYEKASETVFSDTERASSMDCLLSGIPADYMEQPVRRKTAALMLHRAMYRFTREQDDDWGAARNFKDIYDCRVCANAIAQVSVKGIIPPLTDILFGGEDFLEESEAGDSILRLYYAGKRLTKLLES